MFDELFDAVNLDKDDDDDEEEESEDEDALVRTDSSKCSKNAGKST